MLAAYTIVIAYLALAELMSGVLPEYRHPAQTQVLDKDS